MKIMSRPQETCTENNVRTCGSWQTDRHACHITPRPYWDRIIYAERLFCTLTVVVHAVSLYSEFRTFIIPEIREWTDRQTDRQTHRHTHSSQNVAPVTGTKWPYTYSHSSAETSASFDGCTSRLNALVLSTVVRASASNDSCRQITARNTKATQHGLDILTAALWRTCTHSAEMAWVCGHSRRCLLCV